MYVLQVDGNNAEVVTWLKKALVNKKDKKKTYIQMTVNSDCRFLVVAVAEAVTWRLSLVPDSKKPLVKEKEITYVQTTVNSFECAWW